MAHLNSARVTSLCAVYVIERLSRLRITQSRTRYKEREDGRLATWMEKGMWLGRNQNPDGGKEPKGRRERTTLEAVWEHI